MLRPTVPSNQLKVRSRVRDENLCSVITAEESKIARPVKRVKIPTSSATSLASKQRVLSDLSNKSNLAPSSTSAASAIEKRKQLAVIESVAASAAAVTLPSSTTTTTTSTATLTSTATGTSSNYGIAAALRRKYLEREQLIDRKSGRSTTSSSSSSTSLSQAVGMVAKRTTSTTTTSSRSTTSSSSSSRSASSASARTALGSVETSSASSGSAALVDAAAARVLLKAKRKPTSVAAAIHRDRIERVSSTSSTANQVARRSTTLSSSTSTNSLAAKARTAAVALAAKNLALQAAPSTVAATAAAAAMVIAINDKSTEEMDVVRHLVDNDGDDYDEDDDEECSESEGEVRGLRTDMSTCQSSASASARSISAVVGLEKDVDEEEEEAEEGDDEEDGEDADGENETESEWESDTGSQPKQQQQQGKESNRDRIRDHRVKPVASRVVVDDKENARHQAKAMVEVQKRAIATVATATTTTSANNRMSSTHMLSTIFSGVNLQEVDDIDAADRDDPCQCTEYVEDIMQVLRDKERCERPNPEYLRLQKELTHKMRAMLVDWMSEVAIQFGLLSETTFLAVCLMDQFLSRKMVSRSRLQLVGITSMVVACKFEEMRSPYLRDFAWIADEAYTKEDIIRMEKIILSVLNYNIGTPTPLHFLRRFSKAARSDSMTHTLSKYLTELTMPEYRMLAFRPSIIAASAVYLARKIVNKTPVWTKTLEHFTKYTRKDLANCVALLNEIHGHKDGGSFASVKNKYASDKLFNVSKMPAAVLD